MSGVNDHEQRRRARERFKTHYRALYDEVLEILVHTDPLGVHGGDSADRLVPEVASILPRLRDARLADDVEQIVTEELRRWYGRRRLRQLDHERLTHATIAICSAWNHFLAVSAPPATPPGSPDAVH